MRTISCRLAVWILLVRVSRGFSTHLRQSNNSIHTQAKLQQASDILPSSQSALDVTSILRIRASEYLELLRSTFAEVRTTDIISGSGHQQGILTTREITPHAISLYASSVYARKSSFASFLAAIVLVACLLTICIVALPKDEDAEKVAPRPLTELYETNSCNGTWARSYQNADTKDKQALEMLFRCHIIPADEFRNSTINQPHVDECIWIGRRMLVDRSLEEWLDRCSVAQQQFEESLNACSEEKWKVRSGAGTNFPGMGKALDFPLGRDRDLPLPSIQRAQSSPVSPRYELYGRDASPQSGFSPEHAAILKSPDARHRLLLRCTEIMTEYDRERRTSRRYPMSDNDMASPQISPPPTAGDTSNPWPIQTYSSAPPGMYPQSSRNEMSGIASSSDMPPSNLHALPRAP